MSEAARHIAFVIEWLKRPDWGQYQYMEGSEIYTHRDDALIDLNCADGSATGLATSPRAMNARPRALDLFCGAGGASAGLYRAGFDVVGVDIKPQPRYPFSFRRADAMTFPLDGFDFLWASPPCQRFCALNTREDLSHYPDLIEPVRARFIASGKPFVIENVPGAPVRCDVLLCGAMFGLRCYRHRHFECSFPVPAPRHPKHTVRVNRRGENRREHWARGGFMTITGDVGVYCGLGAMGIDWMSGAEMSEAIPPAYSEFIARAWMTGRR